MSCLRRFLLASVAVLCACVPSGVRRPPVKLPGPSVAPIGPNTAGPWRVMPSFASQSVTIATQAIVVITSDTAARTDTLNALLDASYLWARTGRQHVDGSLRGYRISLGGAPASTPAGLQTPRAFSAEAEPGGRSLIFRLPAEAQACTDPALSALQGLHDAWIHPPDTVVAKREWTDTVHTLSCRDRVPLRGTNVRRFRVQRAEVEADGRLVLLIDRASKGRMNGEGEQFGERVTLDGESSGVMHYVLDPSTGRLVRASGSSSLDLSFKSRRRNQRVRQQSALTLTWTP